MLLTQVEYFQSKMQVADDTAAVTANLLALLQSIPLGRKQVHDANLVATMQASAIPRLLTDNTADFSRFGSLIVILPLMPKEHDADERHSFHSVLEIGTIIGKPFEEFAMKTIETEVAVGIDGTAVIQFQLAADIAPGLHRAVVVLEETSTVGGNSEVGRPLQNPYGLWASLGVDLAATEIAELRRDTWSSFPRKDIS